MEQKIDTRIAKTRAALVDAFYKLIGEKEYEEITINELCILANVRRATFYKHFADKNDFLCYVVHSLREIFDKTLWKHDTPLGSKEYFITYAEKLVRFLQKNEVVAHRILDSSCGASVIGILIDQNYVDTRNKLEIGVKEGLKLKTSTRVMADMLTGGVALAIIDWFNNSSSSQSAEHLISDISFMIGRLLD